jgi:type I restriction enzyme, S subunit
VGKSKNRECYEIITGYPFKSKEFAEEGIPVIKIKDIIPPDIYADGCQKVPKEIASNKGKYEVVYGDILVSMTGSNVGQPSSMVGKVGYFRHQGTYLLNQRIANIKPLDEKIIDKRYLYYYFVSGYFKNSVANVLTGSANQANISSEQIKSMELPLPPLMVQKEISSLLGAIDDKIDLNKQMNQTLEEMAMTLYKHWFVDFGPFQDGKFVESELGMIPKGWEIKTLGEVCNILDSKRIPLSKMERQKRQGIYPYYGATSIMDYVDDYIFDGTYVLMGEDGSVMKEDGTPYVQYVTGKFWVNNHAHILDGTNGVSTEWLTVFLKQLNVSPIVTGAVQLKISQGNLKSVKFLLPDEQNRMIFNNKLKNLYKQILLNEEENRILAETRDYLLPKLLSGEIDLSKTEKEVEKVL